MISPITSTKISHHKHIIFMHSPKLHTTLFNPIVKKIYLMHVFLLDRRNDKLLKIHTQNIEGFWYNIQPNNFDISTN
jgi:hypothetical protein